MNLLIVDDEVITIKGMMNGIDWKAAASTERSGRPIVRKVR